MTLTGAKKLETWYRDNKLPSVCLLYGEDGYQIERQTERLLKLAVKAFPDFNLYKADGRVAVRMDELCDSAQSLPFMSDSRAVLLDDLDISAQDAVSMDKLMQLLAAPNEDCCLVITMRTVQPELKKKGSRSAKLVAACEKAGLVCVLPKPMRSDVARAASNRAARAGAKLSSEAAALLADFCGCDMQRALNETDKLAAYINGGEITEREVRLLVAPVVEARVFDLADRLLSGNLEGALNIVSDLFFLRESPMTILSILSMSFADIYRASAARRAGIPSAQAQKELGYFGGSVYRYSKAAEKLGRLNTHALGDAVLLLAEADNSMKQSGVNAPAMLETTVTRLWQLCGRRAG